MKRTDEIAKTIEELAEDERGEGTRRRGALRTLVEKSAEELEKGRRLIAQYRASLALANALAWSLLGRFEPDTFTAAAAELLNAAGENRVAPPYPHAPIELVEAIITGKRGPEELSALAAATKARISSNPIVPSAENEEPDDEN